MAAYCTCCFFSARPIIWPILTSYYYSTAITTISFVSYYFNSFSGILLKNLFSGSLPALLKGGFDWVDVRDVCEATIRIVRLQENKSVNNLNRRFIISGHWATIKDLAIMCSKISNKKMPSVVFSKSIAKLGLPFIKIWAMMSGSAPIYTKESIDTLMDKATLFSHVKAYTEIDYQPRSLNETLQDSYHWYLDNRLI